MKYIGYEELFPGKGYPLMKDNFEEEAYPEKDKIIHFLNNGEMLYARLSRAKDVFTGERIPQEVLGMTSGEYDWPNYLAWYVEKYNLRLPEDFERYILEKIQSNPG